MVLLISCKMPQHAKQHCLYNYKTKFIHKKNNNKFNIVRDIQVFQLEFFSYESKSVPGTLQTLNGKKMASFLRNPYKIFLLKLECRRQNFNLNKVLEQ